MQAQANSQTSRSSKPPVADKPALAAPVPARPAPADVALCGVVLNVRDAAVALETEVGRGATASVWAARRLDAGSAAAGVVPGRLAVKVLSREAAGSAVLRERFEREAMLLCALSHPGIARGYGSGVLEGRPWVALQLVEGPTLRELLAQGALPPRRALGLTMQVAAALNYLYMDGRMRAHRDIKPSNIMCMPDGRALLVDLGVAGSAFHVADDIDTGFLGTLAYMAPEQIDCAGRADIRSDLYSLGAVFHEMLTGRRAFAGERRSEVLLAHLQGDVPRLPATGGLRNPALRAACQRILDATLQADPTARVQTPGQLMALIAAAQQARPGRSHGLLERLSLSAQLLGTAGVGLAVVLVVFSALVK